MLRSELVFPTCETLIVQGLATVLVIGSYFLACYRRVWSPGRHGEAKADLSDATLSSSRQPQSSLAGWQGGLITVGNSFYEVEGAEGNDQHEQDH